MFASISEGAIPCGRIARTVRRLALAVTERTTAFASRRCPVKAVDAARKRYRNSTTNNK